MNGIFRNVFTLQEDLRSLGLRIRGTMAIAWVATSQRIFYVPHWSSEHLPQNHPTLGDLLLNLEHLGLLGFRNQGSWFRGRAGQAEVPIRVCSPTCVLILVEEKLQGPWCSRLLVQALRVHVLI